MIRPAASGGAFRSELGEPLEAAWRSARPGETPGGLVPGDDPVQPVDALDELVVPIEAHRLAVTLRLRWRFGDWWRSARLRAGSWVAGVELAEDGGEWW